MDSVERFWAKVDRNGPVMRVPLGPCAVWTGGTRPNGYGRIKVNGKWYSTHRFAWVLAHGDIPDGLCVLHACDNKPCVLHLFLGTQVENVADRDAKGRGCRGDSHWSRTTPEKLCRGETHFAHVNGASWMVGDSHWSRKHPEHLARGEANGSATLTEAIVRTIRTRVANGERAASVARDVGVSKQCIGAIVHRKSWTHVT